MLCLTINLESTFLTLDIYGRIFIEEPDIEATLMNSSILKPKTYELIGAFIGDGWFNCYNGRHYTVGFSGDIRFDLGYIHDTIVPAVKSLDPKSKPKYFHQRGSNGFYVKFNSKKLFGIFQNHFQFKPGPKSKNVKIPNFIMQGNQDYLFLTIRGIYDTDGCVYFDKREVYRHPYPRIALQTSSNALFEQLCKILATEFNLYSGRHKAHNAYIIDIYGWDQLKRWMSIVGFSNPRHLDEVNSAFASVA